MTFREQLIEQARSYFDVNTNTMRGVEFTVSPESALEIIDPLPGPGFIFETPVGPVRVRVDRNLPPNVIKAERLPNAVTSRAPERAS